MQLVMKILILVFVVSSMAALGMTLRLSELVKPLLQLRLVVVTLAVNFLMSPGIAYLLTSLMPVNTSYETGLLLLSAAAGAPFLPKLVEVAAGDIPLSVSILLLQLVGSIVLMPLLLPYLIPGLQADALSIAMPMLLQMMLPLLLGIILQQTTPWLATQLQPPLQLLSGVSAIGAVILLLLTNMSGMLGTLGSGAGLQALLFVALTMCAGYGAGGLIRSSPIVHALAGGQRNIAAALVISASNHLDEMVMAMLIMTTFLGLLPLIGAAAYSKRLRTTPKTTQGTAS